MIKRFRKDIHLCVFKKNVGLLKNNVLLVLLKDSINDLVLIECKAEKSVIPYYLLLAFTDLHSELRKK